MATDGITVISIGTNSGAAPLSVTVGVGGVPTGAHIFVVVADNGSTQGSVADPTLNSYLQAGAAFNTGIGINTFRSRTGNALTNGQTITYTPGNGTLASISAFYVLGLSPQGSDSSFNNTATGTSASPSVTSQGPPTLKAAEYEFIVGVVGGATLQSSFTQDSTNAAWTSPPGQVSLAAPVLGGGNVVLSSSASNLTYNPAFNSSDVWAASISAYAIQVFELESKPARFSPTQRYARFLYNNWSEQPPVAEDNQHFLARFRPAQQYAHVQYKAFRYNFNGCDISGPLGPQPDSNTHFVPPFTAVKTTRFAFNSLNTDSSSAQPVAETNTHFLARFASAPQYRALRLESWRDDGQPVQETNTHFLAQYRAPKYNVFLYGLDSREQPPVAEAQPHFLGRFAQTRYSRFSYNYSGSDFPAVAESQPHFLGRFTQAKYSRFLYNGADISGFVPQVETNTHFLAKFTSAKNYSQFQYNLNTSEQPPVAEAQPHFLGRFQATKYSRFRFNGADISGFIPQPETNTNFIAAFKPAALKVNAALSQNTSYDVEIETNQHVLARYRSVSLTVSLPLRQNAPTSDVVAETNTQSIGRFQAAKLATPTGLRFHTNEDITVSAPETNVSTIGRFYRPQIALLASLWNNAATDQIALPNPHFIGKFAPTKYARFNYNSDSCEFPAVAETQPHFIGKFAPAQYGRFRFNDGFDVTGITSTQPETNVNFIGRFQPTNLHVTVFNGSDFNPPEPQVFYSKTRVRAVMTSYTSLV